MTPLELEFVVAVAGIESPKQLVGHLVGSEVEGDPAIANADDAREVGQREVDAVEIHQERLPVLVGQVAEDHPAIGAFVSGVYSVGRAGFAARLEHAREAGTPAERAVMRFVDAAGLE